MNANELADYLLSFIMAIEDYDESKHAKAATMLRKLDGQLAFRIDAVTKYQEKVEEQQAEIAKVNAEWVQAAMAVGKAVHEIRELQAEIEALKDKLHLAQQSLSIIEGWTK